MSTTRVFRYDLRYQDGAWLVEIPDVVPGTKLAGSVRLARQADAMAQLLIAGELRLDAATVLVSLATLTGFPIDATALVERARDARIRAGNAQVVSNQHNTEAVVILVSLGIPIRDVGHLLGISHQRVSQINYAATGEFTVDEVLAGGSHRENPTPGQLSRVQRILESNEELAEAIGPVRAGPLK